MSTQKNLPANEELVEYMAPLIGAATKKDVIVGVNGETIRIKRGVPVKIKRKFLKVLRQAAAQEYAAYQVMEQAQKGAAVALAEDVRKRGEAERGRPELPRRAPFSGGVFMKIKEAIASARKLSGNAVDDAALCRWLSELDGG